MKPPSKLPPMKSGPYAGNDPMKSGPYLKNMLKKWGKHEEAFQAALQVQLGLLY
jgi:hypothetical protein